MKTIVTILFILTPMLCFGQLWTIDAGGDFVFCDGDEDIQLQGIITNPTNDSLTVLWETEYSIGSNTFYAEDFLDNVNSLTPTLFAPNLLVAEPKLTFYLTVSDTLGNNQRDSVSVFVSNFGTDLEDFQFHINQGDSVVLRISAFGGSPPYTYEWMPNDNILDNTKRNPVVFPNFSTNYSVTITDSNGCVIPALYCDVNEVYVTPLSLIEINDSDIEWYTNENHLIIKSEKLAGEDMILYDICGKPINTFRSIEGMLNVNMYNLERGMYFVRIENNVLKFTW